MMTFGILSFAAPWALAALAALPVLWWLLRITPPAPQRLRFPPIRLLFDLVAREESAAKSPLWLLLLRLILATFLILGASEPLLNATSEFRGDGPLVLVVDDGWASATNWPGRQAMLTELIDQAQREERSVFLVTTAAQQGPLRPIERMNADDARRRAETLRPNPWTTNREALNERLARLPGLDGGPPAQVIWLSDGLDDGNVEAFITSLRHLGPLRVVLDPPGQPTVVLRPPVWDGPALRVPVVRLEDRGDEVFGVRAYGEDGTLLARQDVRFAAGNRIAETRLELPSELRNRLARMHLENQTTAGAVVLLDERWRRRPVGLITGEHTVGEQPLLSEFHYIERALTPYTEVRRGSVNDLLARELAVLVLADSSRLSDSDHDLIASWVGKGGVLLRFAGPNLADSEPDESHQNLLPIPLRKGGRTLGGALSWTQPATLAPFTASSPFFGLEIPPDVTVQRQVLAQPTVDLSEKTWVSLSDGTPLVTADRRGRGWLVLFHTTATPTWSDLPMSGLFVDILRRLVALSQGVVKNSETGPLTPVETIDGFGRLGPPPATARVLEEFEPEEGRIGPAHPPGYYGTTDARRALNLSAALGDLRAIGPLPSGVDTDFYGEARQFGTQSWFLGAALILLLIDLAVSLAMRGLLRARVATAALTLLVLWGGDVRAQGVERAGDDTLALAATLETRLAYVVTGDDRIDEVSRAGLTGLSFVVNRRTAAELGAPVGVDLETEEVLFYPFLYWPVTEFPPPSSGAAERLAAYLAEGGVILFDTRDPNGAVSAAALRDLADRLEIPSLVPVPADHVLSRSYYLLKDFPGRWTGGILWIERAGERVNDGVSSVVAGSHDWAAAWAVDPAQRPLFPVVPGGERQREFAYRFGINLLMYALTGNYKGDQVHLPAIMKRLGL